MRVAIMQPYFLPYIGYFQLIGAVDKFVILDDVNYINKGWINRNNFLCNGLPYLATIPLSGASQNKKINEIFLSTDKKWKINFLKTIETVYKKSSQFDKIQPQLEFLILQAVEKTISEFNLNLLTWVTHYLKLETEIIHSSSVFNNSYLKGEDRIIDICKQLQATEYLNAIGGIKLYDKDHFLDKDIELKFVKTEIVPYKQVNTKFDFVSNLSILDYLMNIEVENIIVKLKSYQLI